MKADNHIHTPFCPHGSSDSFQEYIQRGIELGLEEMTFTEHAPLPETFIDPTPDKDSGMDPDALPAYFKELQAIKQQYWGKMNIRIGLEIDFIEGYEEETVRFLNENGPFLDDAILSVHFIRHEDQWHCIDFHEDTFHTIANKMGSVDAVYQKYFDTLEKSIVTDLGLYKPKRIGHITLAHKFQKKYPPAEAFDRRIYHILDLIRKHEYELDYNGAGAVKPLCREPYPPERFAKYALQLGIPLRYGSDAHQAKGLGQGFSSLIPGFSVIK
ncbi:histidinol-phosphatase HisJ [Bacillus massiliglaciei]|uniref:histidinol-phosphatase HisJ n=1 Tax=Bacillus massiliglaciei TaxID=1816693 RepID=UPI000AD02DE6|nr:histidinol-phosphatase HisJ [Bacillus massiliglaciei]